MRCICPLLTQSGHFDAGPRSTSIAAGFGLSSRTQFSIFIYIQRHFPQGRMIMSAQSSSATRRRTTAVEPDELVPSRYALRVGEIDVLVVRDGVLSLPGAMLAYNADPANR